jgi:stage II sporulation protein D
MNIPRHTEARGRCASGRPRRRGRLALAGTLAAAILLISASPAAAWSTATKFTINGHGWGHGIGMSQWGAYGYAKHGWTYTAILKHYYTGVAFASKVANSNVRVRLRSGLKSVKVTCPAAYTVRGTGNAVQIPGGTTATTTYVNSKYHVVAGSLTKDFTSAVTFSPVTTTLRIVTATDLNDTGPYRGTIRVLNTTGGLMMINKLPLEKYLRGVVPHEASASWPAEALKAQACAARAYAVCSLNPSASWDVFTDARDQVYMGAGGEDSRTNAAVTATSGVVPRYNGKVITAYYFSCSGGHTENIELSWPGASPAPYLKGVNDPYDYYGSLHNWGPLYRTGSQLAAALGTAVKGSLRAVYTVVHGTSPRIVKAAIIGSSGTTFMDGNMLRVKANLNSTWAVFRSVAITPAPSNNPAIKAGGSLTLSGRIYPGLAASATMTLNSYYGGAWHTRTVTTQRVSQDLGQGYKAVYSTCACVVKPTQTTKYYFSSGTAVSPTTTVTVN